MARTSNKTRFHSLALGKELNFTARTDGLIGAADTTPSVDIYSLLYNSSTNTISYFDDGTEGQLVHVINNADEQCLFSGTQMKVANSAGLWNAGDNITFINHNSSWYEISRSVVGQEVATIAALGDATPSVKGASIVIANSSGADTITDFDDAHEGQQITLLNVGAGTVTLTDDVTKLVVGASGGDLAVEASATAKLVSYNGVWYVTSAVRDLGLL